VLYFNIIIRAYHTRHGQHLNRIDEQCIIQEISKIICNNKKIISDVIVLGFSNQGNNKKTGSQRLQSLQNKEKPIKAKT
jgi:hypothetical protein